MTIDHVEKMCLLESYVNLLSAWNYAAVISHCINHSINLYIYVMKLAKYNLKFVSVISKQVKIVLKTLDNFVVFAEVYNFLSIIHHLVTFVKFLLTHKSGNDSSDLHTNYARLWIRYFQTTLNKRFRLQQNYSWILCYYTCSNYPSIQQQYNEHTHCPFIAYDVEFYCSINSPYSSHHRRILISSSY